MLQGQAMLPGHINIHLSADDSFVTFKLENPRQISENQ